MGSFYILFIMCTVIGLGQDYRFWTRLLKLRWKRWSEGEGFELVDLGWTGSLVSGWLTNVEMALSLPAVLEVMDKWMANLTLWAKVQDQPEKSLFGFCPKRGPYWFFPTSFFFFLDLNSLSTSATSAYVKPCRCFFREQNRLTFHQTRSDSTTNQSPGVILFMQ